MRAVDDGRLDAGRSGQPAGCATGGASDRGDVTIRDLLAHASGLTGLPAVLPRLHRTRRIRARHLHAAARVRAALAIHLQRSRVHAARRSSSRTRSRLARRSAARRARSIRRAALATQFHRLASFFTAEPLRFNPPRAWRPRTAPTEVDAWRGRLLVGEVHDENTWALGGAAGHAGLFGTAAAVGAFARAVAADDRRRADPRRAATRCATFITRTDVPGSSRALGWDTMLPTSSCGTQLSPDVDRPHRLHRDVALDRLGARPLRRVPDQPRAPDAGQRSDPADPAACCTTPSSPSWRHESA